jgi:hypothetical protein
VKSLTCAVLLAIAFVASGSAGMAASKKVHKTHKTHKTHKAHEANRVQKLPDWSKPTHGYPLNSKEGQRGFWQDQELRQR